MPSSGSTPTATATRWRSPIAAGKPIAAMRIGNDSAGFAQLLAAIAEAAPGPRVAVCIEGSRSYGIGLARALAAAGCW